MLESALAAAQQQRDALEAQTAQLQADHSKLAKERATMMQQVRDSFIRSEFLGHCNKAACCGVYCFAWLSRL